MGFQERLGEVAGTFPEVALLALQQMFVASVLWPDLTDEADKARCNVRLMLACKVVDILHASSDPNTMTPEQRERYAAFEGELRRVTCPPNIVTPGLWRALPADEYLALYDRCMNGGGIALGAALVGAMRAAEFPASVPDGHGTLSGMIALSARQYGFKPAPLAALWPTAKPIAPYLAGLAALHAELRMAGEVRERMLPHDLAELEIVLSMARRAQRHMTEETSEGDPAHAPADAIWTVPDELPLTVRLERLDPTMLAALMPGQKGAPRKGLSDEKLQAIGLELQGLSAQKISDRVCVDERTIKRWRREQPYKDELARRRAEG